VKHAWKDGSAFVWLTGGALAFALLMVGALVLLLLVCGMGAFWPRTLYEFRLRDGRTVIGQIAAREAIPAPDAPAGTPARHRIQVRQGNRDLYGADFVWLDEDALAGRSAPADLFVIERLEWGDFIGRLAAVKGADGAVLAAGADAPAAARRQLPDVLRAQERIRRVERRDIGAINMAMERARLRLRKLELRGARESREARDVEAGMERLHADFSARRASLAELRAAPVPQIELLAAGGHTPSLPLSRVVRLYAPNAMGFAEKVAHYAGKLWEFVSTDPREANTEGGVLPALFGTVLMVLLMSLVVTPLGVIAAFYLREYAKQGPLVSAVRIAVNNLAGVPSIVFGVFGVGFFIYIVGGSLDRWFFSEALPTPTYGTGGILWASLTLALLTVPVVIVATEEGLAAIPPGAREASLALGATKFETTTRVVLPAVLPAILTGQILAMARAAGEVAPLMITGVVKLAPTLPVDGAWPYLHLERKFMHLGFHIYDVGFQSPNVDAARPMVFMTAVLLLLLVLLLNMAAIVLRGKLRKKYGVTAL
jgi:phosphate transport system permease protein